MTITDIYTKHPNVPLIKIEAFLGPTFLDAVEQMCLLYRGVLLVAMFRYVVQVN